MANRDKFKVQVWNDRDDEWKELFKGEPLSIPARSFVEMEFYDAFQFKGQMNVLLDDGNGGIAAKSEKKIRCVEKAYQDHLASGGDDAEPQDDFRCNLCKEDFNTAKLLVEHSEKMHASRIVQDEVAEASIPKRKPGRPAKVLAEKTA